MYKYVCNLAKLLIILYWNKQILHDSATACLL
jgi:hypothetical protein